MKSTKLHKVLKCKQSDWMKKYIDFNNEKRMNAAMDFEKDFLKLMITSVYGKAMEKLQKRINVRLVNKAEDFLILMINSVYGKAMESLRKRINVRLVNKAEDFLKYTSKPTCITHTIFGKDYSAIHEIKPVLML